MVLTMKAFKKLMVVIFLSATIASFLSVSVFAASPQLNNVTVSSLVSGKNVIQVNNSTNKFVTNASKVRISFQIQDPNGAISSGKVKFFGEQAMADMPIVYSGTPNQFYIDWTIPDITGMIRDCRLVVYCTDVATGLEDRVDQYIDIKYCTDNVIAEPINTSVSDLTGYSFYVQSIIYDLTLSGVKSVSFDFVKAGVPYTQNNSASISNMGNNTYWCGATLTTSNWGNSDGEYRASMSATTNSGYCTLSVIRSVYLNSPNLVPSLYQNANFTGNKAYVEEVFYGWETGNYNLADLQAKNISANDISSIIVPAGYQITVYDSDYFMGASYTFSQGSYNLSNYGWDNRIESVKVVRI